MRTKATNGSQDPNEGERQPFSTVDWRGGLGLRQLITSSAMHLLGGLALGLISLLVIPDILEPERNLEISFLTEAPIEEEPLPPLPKPPAPKPMQRPEPAPRPAPSEIRPPEIVEVPKAGLPDPVVPPSKPPVEVAPPAPPKREIRTDLFAKGSPAASKPTAPARSVQTGGFGDPEGVAANGSTRNPVARPSLGEFDLPAGPGRGNGTGGARGLPGAVASAGFGDGAATEETGAAPASRDAVRQAGFAEAKASAEAPRRKPRVEELTTHPVEIVFKPKPAYTDEARQRHLEGEVVLEVVFTAAGRPEVLRVVSGLGSGLDESAMRAAEKILFKPARRDGQPVDYTAVVRILFQLT